MLCTGRDDSIATMDMETGLKTCLGFLLEQVSRQQKNVSIPDIIDQDIKLKDNNSIRNLFFGFN